MLRGAAGVTVGNLVQLAGHPGLPPPSLPEAEVSDDDSDYYDDASTGSEEDATEEDATETSAASRYVAAQERDQAWRTRERFVHEYPRSEEARLHKYHQLYCTRRGLRGDHGAEWLRLHENKYGAACHDSVSVPRFKAKLVRDTQHLFTTRTVELPLGASHVWDVQDPILTFALDLYDQDLMSQPGVRIRAETIQTATGERVFGPSFYTGEVQEALDAEFVGDADDVLCLSLDMFVDAATADDAGNLKVCPIVLTLHCLPKYMTFGVAGGENPNSLLRVVVGYIPDIGEVYSAEELKRLCSRDKVIFHHQYINAVLMFLREANEGGGTLLRIAGPGEGKMYRCRFVIGSIPNDTVEGNALTCTFNANRGNANVPCRLCWRPRQLCAVPCAHASTPLPMKTNAQRLVFQQAVAREGGAVGAQTALEQRFSMHGVAGEQLLLDSSLVGGTQHGLQVAGPDTLHVMHGGQVQRVRWGVQAVATANAYGPDLERHGTMLALEFAHQADRDLVHLRHTTSLLKPGKVSAQDQPGLLLHQLLAVSAPYGFVEDWDDENAGARVVRGHIFNAVQRTRLFSAASDMLIVACQLAPRTHVVCETSRTVGLFTESDAARWTQNVHNCFTSSAAAFGPSSTLAVAFMANPKAHQMYHVVALQRATAGNCDTRSHESAMGAIVKTPASQTGLRRRQLGRDTAGRWRLHVGIMRRLQDMARHRACFARAGEQGRPWTQVLFGWGAPVAPRDGAVRRARREQLLQGVQPSPALAEYCGAGDLEALKFFQQHHLQGTPLKVADRGYMEDGNSTPLWATMAATGGQWHDHVRLKGGQLVQLRAFFEAGGHSMVLLHVYAPPRAQDEISSLPLLQRRVPRSHLVGRTLCDPPRGMLPKYHVAVQSDLHDRAFVVQDVYRVGVGGVWEIAPRLFWETYDPASPRAWKDTLV